MELIQTLIQRSTLPWDLDHDCNSANAYDTLDNEKHSIVYYYKTHTSSLVSALSKMTTGVNIDPLFASLYKQLHIIGTLNDPYNTISRPKLGRCSDYILCSLKIIEAYISSQMNETTPSLQQIVHTALPLISKFLQGIIQLKVNVSSEKAILCLAGIYATYYQQERFNYNNIGPHVLQLLLNLLSTTQTAQDKKKILSYLFSISTEFKRIDYTSDNGVDVMTSILSLISEPTFITTPHGQKLVVLWLTVNETLTDKLHSYILSLLSGIKATSSLSHIYASIYSQAWRLLVNMKHDGIYMLNYYEKKCLGTFAKASLYAQVPSTVLLSRFILIQGFLTPSLDQSANAKMLIHQLLYSLYSPIIFPALSSVTATVRSNALQALADIFPLTPSSTQDRHLLLTKQVSALSQALLDDDINIRALACNVTTRICSIWWSLLQPIHRERDKLIYIVFKKHAYDKTSSHVRLTAIKSITSLILNGETHTLLKSLLPLLNNCLFDPNEDVVIAYIELLSQTIHTERLPFTNPDNNFTTINDLHTALAKTTSNAVTNKLTHLLRDTYLPATASNPDKLDRFLTLLRQAPQAAITLAETVFITHPDPVIDTVIGDISSNEPNTTQGEVQPETQRQDNLITFVTILLRVLSINARYIVWKQEQALPSVHTVENTSFPVDPSTGKPSKTPKSPKENRILTLSEVCWGVAVACRLFTKYSTVQLPNGAKEWIGQHCMDIEYIAIAILNAKSHQYYLRAEITPGTWVISQSTLDITLNLTPATSTNILTHLISIARYIPLSYIPSLKNILPSLLGTNMAQHVFKLLAVEHEDYMALLYEQKREIENEQIVALENNTITQSDYNDTLDAINSTLIEACVTGPTQLTLIVQYCNLWLANYLISHVKIPYHIIEQSIIMKPIQDSLSEDGIAFLEDDQLPLDTGLFAPMSFYIYGFDRKLYDTITLDVCINVIVYMHTQMNIVTQVVENMYTIKDSPGDNDDDDDNNMTITSPTSSHHPYSIKTHTPFAFTTLLFTFISHLSALCRITVLSLSDIMAYTQYAVNNTCTEHNITAMTTTPQVISQQQPPQSKTSKNKKDKGTTVGDNTIVQHKPTHLQLYNIFSSSSSCNATQITEMNPIIETITLETRQSLLLLVNNIMSCTIILSSRYIDMISTLYSQIDQMVPRGTSQDVIKKNLEVQQIEKQYVISLNILASLFSTLDIYTHMNIANSNMLLQYTQYLVMNSNSNDDDSNNNDNDENSMIDTQPQQTKTKGKGSNRIEKGAAATVAGSHAASQPSLVNIEHISWCVQLLSQYMLLISDAIKTQVLVFDHTIVPYSCIVHTITNGIISQRIEMVSKPDPKQHYNIVSSSSHISHLSQYNTLVHSIIDAIAPSTVALTYWLRDSIYNSRLCLFKVCIPPSPLFSPSSPLQYNMFTFNNNTLFIPHHVKYMPPPLPTLSDMPPIFVMDAVLFRLEEAHTTFLFSIALSLFQCVLQFPIASPLLVRDTIYNQACLDLLATLVRNETREIIEFVSSKTLQMIGSICTIDHIINNNMVYYENVLTGKITSSSSGGETSTEVSTTTIKTTSARGKRGKAAAAAAAATAVATPVESTSSMSAITPETLLFGQHYIPVDTYATIAPFCAYPYRGICIVSRCIQLNGPIPLSLYSRYIANQYSGQLSANIDTTQTNASTYLQWTSNCIGSFLASDLCSQGVISAVQNISTEIDIQRYDYTQILDLSTLATLPKKSNILSLFHFSHTEHSLEYIILLGIMLSATKPTLGLQSLYTPIDFLTTRKSNTIVEDVPLLSQKGKGAVSRSTTSQDASTNIIIKLTKSQLRTTIENACVVLGTLIDAYKAGIRKLDNNSPYKADTPIVSIIHLSLPDSSYVPSKTSLVSSLIFDLQTEFSFMTQALKKQ